MNGNTGNTIINLIVGGASSCTSESVSNNNQSVQNSSTSPSNPLPHCDSEPVENRDAPTQPDEPHHQSKFKGQIIGYNGNDQEFFNDSLAAELTESSPTITGISKIEIQYQYYDGCVHHLAVTYRLSNGGRLTKAHGLLRSSTPTSYAVKTIDLLDSEVITSVSGRYSWDRIHEIQFQIKDTAGQAVRTAGPYGSRPTWLFLVFNTPAGLPFSCQGRVMALAGYCHDHLGYLAVGGLSFICQDSEPSNRLFGET